MSAGEASKGALTMSSLQYSNETVNIFLDDEFMNSRDDDFHHFLIKWYGHPDFNATWI